jgi:NAD-dependent dihydropyrimidine dehydrogenase PreA subunit
VAYYVTELCVDVLDRSCIQECPVDCIYEGDRSMYINPDECIDCGACEWVCPVKAIKYDVDLPADQQHVVERTRAWVAANNATGGSRTLGRIGVDHPDIAAMPPQTRKDA